jgi:hypothetical protein
MSCDISCETTRELMPLYYYGELPPEQEENLEAHCAACSPCGREVERYRSFAGVLDEAELEPSLGLLSECRQMLAQRVTEWERPAPKLNWWRTLLSLNLDFRVPVGAVALIAVGWFGARIAPALTGQNVSSAGVMSSVRSVEPDASGRLVIAVDDIQRRVVSGGVNDVNVRRLLLAAARDESNPGVQVECVDALKKMAQSADVRAALLDAVQRDPSPGVRLKALEGLKGFTQDTEIRKALTAVLMNDANAGVRVEAIDLLVAHRDDSMVGVLQNMVRKEDDGYVRVRLQKALQEMNASVGTF